MLILNCTNCHAMLEVDEAFAGGVCRCRHCGAIQTVPIHLKHKNSTGKKKHGRTLYSKEPTDDGQPAAAPLKSPQRTVPTPTTWPDKLGALIQTKPTQQQLAVMILISGLVIVVIVLIIILARR